MNGILIIAHTPLASALRACALHVFPDCASGVQAVDVPADEAPEDTLVRAQQAMQGLGGDGVLLISDVFGATPCNVAQKLNDGVSTRLVSGANLPMLLRAITYREKGMETMLSKAISGGRDGVMNMKDH
jgi:PTS system ascorbate-specific IIA component